MRHSSLLSLGFALLSAVTLTLPACSHPQDAELASTSANYSVQDKRIYLVYGSLVRSIAIKEIENFCSTGFVTGDLGNIIRFGKLNEKDLKNLLTQERPMSLVETSGILNNTVGQAILKKIGEAVYPHKSPSGAVQAIRAAIVLSLEDDQLSILEVLRNLPVDMTIDLAAALKLRDDLAAAFPKD